VEREIYQVEHPSGIFIYEMNSEEAKRDAGVSKRSIELLDDKKKKAEEARKIFQESLKQKKSGEGQ
jgi:hypothetical protein